MEGIENRDMQKIDKYLEQVFDIIFFFVIIKYVYIFRYLIICNVYYQVESLLFCYEKKYNVWCLCLNRKYLYLQKMYVLFVVDLYINFWIFLIYFSSL